MKKRVFIVALLLIAGFNILPFGMTNNKIIVTRKEYQAENSTNLVLNKILSDNELKEEIPNMFYYASNGNYMDRNTSSLSNDPNYITNGLYSNIDEDGTTYYYRGDIDNNNLVFGAYDEDYYVYRSEMTIFKQKRVV